MKPQTVSIYVQSIKDMTQEPSIAQEETIKQLNNLRDVAVSCMRAQFKLFAERIEEYFKQLSDSKSEGKKMIF